MKKQLMNCWMLFNDISNDELVTIADKHTHDPNSKSIQAILSHVVGSAYVYAIYISNMRGAGKEKPSLKFHLTINEYQIDLKKAFEFNVQTFTNIHDNELEEPDNSKKIITSWGQSYDIEQIMEHAIVHILRHRRQIEKFKLALRKPE